MKITDLAGKRVCILGFGREGKAMLEAMEKHGIECEVTIADANPDIEADNQKPKTKNHQTIVGPDYLKDLDSFDVLIKSPGIPPNPQLNAHGSKLSSSTAVFFDTVADSGATVIGVTGSKGKSTTASLIHAILKEAGKDALLLGNVGEPAIAHIDEVKKGTIVVLEMSSYQLADLHVSPHIAVVTSFFPEHLDYHGSLAAYLDAKKNIARHQKEDDVLFFPHASADAVEIAKQGEGRKIPFDASMAPVTIDETQLIGEHNLSNIAAAWAVAKEIGIKEAIAVKAITSFQGLPHRLQSLGMHHGLEWIDDAISTTPESTVAALDALNDRVATIILGGQDRGYDFTALAERIKESNIETVILFPGSGPRIKQALEEAGASVTFHEASSMEEAVEFAKAQSPKPEARSPIVLLSTASPSYGMFRNFEDKGEQFKRLIEAA